MKIAFATIFDSRDISRGSGTFYYLARTLEEQGHELIRVGPLEVRFGFWTHLLQSIHWRLRRRYLTFLDPMVGRQRAIVVERQLASSHYDVLLTNDLGVAAYCRAGAPIVVYTDAMITVDYIERHLPKSRVGNLTQLGLVLFRHTIRRALKRSALCVFGASWAADEAKRYAPNADVEVVHFGANIEDPGPQIARGRSIGLARPLRLLFVGKEWERKGGAIALGATEELARRGVAVRLDVVGPDKAVVPKCAVARCHGLLRKDREDELEMLRRLFVEADFLILPSSSEGFVIAVLEAAAYGLPVLAYRTMGVEQAVIANETGILLELGAPATDFAEAVYQLVQSPGEYARLAKCAREHYEKSVNWPSAVRRLTELMDRKGLWG
jgi:glycosyltransferase involved in cell wall biosynthesis